MINKYFYSRSRVEYQYIEQAHGSGRKKHRINEIYVVNFKIGISSGMSSSRYLVQSTTYVLRRYLYSFSSRCRRRLGTSSIRDVSIPVCAFVLAVVVVVERSYSTRTCISMTHTSILTSSIYSACLWIPQVLVS